MMKLVSSILAIALAGGARAASVSDELDLDSEGKNSCTVGSYRTTSCQTWCQGAIADKWATNHGCDLKQVQDITNHHKEWDWLSCDTSTIPLWDQVTTSRVEGKGPSCKCAYGKCCGSRDAETNDRCFKNDGKTTCSIGSKLACCCESSVVEVGLEDELGVQDGPFLRVKID